MNGNNDETMEMESSAKRARSSSECLSESNSPNPKRNRCEEVNENVVNGTHQDIDKPVSDSTVKEEQDLSENEEDDGHVISQEIILNLSSDDDSVSIKGEVNGDDTLMKSNEAIVETSNTQSLPLKNEVSDDDSPEEPSVPKSLNSDDDSISINEKLAKYSPRKDMKSKESDCDSPLKKNSLFLKQSKKKLAILSETESDSSDDYPPSKSVPEDLVEDKQVSKVNRSNSDKKSCINDSSSEKREKEVAPKPKKKIIAHKHMLENSKSHNSSDSQDNLPVKLIASVRNSHLKDNSSKKKQKELNRRPSNTSKNMSYEDCSDIKYNKTVSKLKKEISAKKERQENSKPQRASDSEDDIPLKKTVSAKNITKKKHKKSNEDKPSGAGKEMSDEESSDDELPGKTASKHKKKLSAIKNKQEILESCSSSDSEDDVPLNQIVSDKNITKKEPSESSEKSSVAGKMTSSEDSADDETSRAKAKPKTKILTEKKKQGNLQSSNLSDSEDNLPLKEAVFAKNNLSKDDNAKEKQRKHSKKPPGVGKKMTSEDSSDDELPIKTLFNPNNKISAKMIKQEGSESLSSSDSEDDVPLKQTVSNRNIIKKKPRKSSTKSSVVGEKKSSKGLADDEPIKKVTSKPEKKKLGGKKNQEISKSHGSSDSEDDVPLKQTVSEKKITKKDSSKSNGKPSVAEKKKSNKNNAAGEPLSRSTSKPKKKILTEEKKQENLKSRSDSEDDHSLKNTVSAKNNPGKGDNSKEKQNKNNKKPPSTGKKMPVEDSSDDELSAKTTSKSKKKISAETNKRENSDSLSSNDSEDDVPLKQCVSSKSITKKEPRKSSEISSVAGKKMSSGDSTDDEPLSKATSKPKKKVLDEKKNEENLHSHSSSDSEDDLPLKEAVHTKNTPGQGNKSVEKQRKSSEKRIGPGGSKSSSDSSDNDAVNENKEDSSSADDSETENISQKENLSPSNASKSSSECGTDEDSSVLKSVSEKKQRSSVKDNKSDSDSGPDPDLDSEPLSLNKETNTVKSKNEKKSHKTDISPHQHPAVIRLKKYLAAAGIRVTRYDSLWEGCKSMKDRINKMKSLLEEAGIKGRPTLEKCRRYKKKKETEEEVAELNKNAILCEGRRSQRRSTTETISPAVVEESRKVFSRIKAVFNDSDSD